MKNIKSIILFLSILILVAGLVYLIGKKENGLVGKKAPEFSLADQEGKIYSLKDLKGKNIVIFFNEGAMCYPSCWEQIVAFSKDNRFNNNETITLSIIVDSPQEWQEAIKKMPELAKAIVLFDRGGIVSKKFGVLTLPSSMHPGIYPGHTYVLIDKKGIVRYIFDDPNMGIRNDFLFSLIKKLD